MSVQHAVITDPNIHEPKGIATAAVNTIYKADGLGSGAWEHNPGSVHGEIYLAGASVSVGPTGGTITTDADYRNIGPTWTLNPETYNVSLYTDNKAAQVAVTGHYMVHAFATVLSGAAAAGTQYALKYRINNSATLSTRKLVNSKETAGAQYIAFSGSALVSLTAGDYVDLMLGSSAIDTVTVTDAGLILVLIHE